MSYVFLGIMNTILGYADSLVILVQGKYNSIVRRHIWSLVIIWTKEEGLLNISTSQPTDVAFTTKRN